MLATTSIYSKLTNPLYWLRFLLPLKSIPTSSVCVGEPQDCIFIVMLVKSLPLRSPVGRDQILYFDPKSEIQVSVVIFCTVVPLKGHVLSAFDQKSDQVLM